MEAIRPMLAVRAEPFDSPEYVFEVKWNGVRALAARDGMAWHLWGRDQADYRARYPELAVLSRLADGTVLDGEVVLLRDGLPDLGALLGRHPRSGARAIAALSRESPVTYVVFDALYDRGRRLLAQPLESRRAIARERVLHTLGDARVAFSEGVVGTGRAWFEQAVRQGHEGIMAKHRASPYRPGRRCAAWKKIKPGLVLPAVILGYVPARAGVRGLFVAALGAGGLSYAAHLRGGWTGPMCRQLGALLGRRVRDRPAVPCPERGVWVDPDLYCQVRFLGWTRHGRLRGASFGGLLPA